MSSGVAHAAFALWSVLAILCATVCGRMLMAAERAGLSSQAWLAAVCFALWALLAALTFWEAV
jgi:hypothetical protein